MRLEGATDGGSLDPAAGAVDDAKVGAPTDGASDDGMSLLRVEDLRVSVEGIAAVDGVSFELRKGSRTGLIGESGSGKTLTALAVMGLLSEGLSASGRVHYAGEDLLSLPESRMGKLRGDRLAMVFQEPMSALNPVMRVGRQISEVIRIHGGKDGAPSTSAEERAVELLHRVGMPDAEDKMRAYPHQLSGGQRQRVMIAMAIALGPDLLIADEPTTALDVTVQAQILVLLRDLVEQEGMALLLITHDLPVVAGVCDDVLVMYGGRVVEAGETRRVFSSPRHPYTYGLLQATPELGRRRRVPEAERRLPAIPGSVPGLGQFPSGCVFRNRCFQATEKCAEVPPLAGETQPAACWYPLSEEVA